MLGGGVSSESGFGLTEVGEIGTAVGSGVGVAVGITVSEAIGNSVGGGVWESARDRRSGRLRRCGGARGRGGIRSPGLRGTGESGGERGFRGG